MKAPRGGRWAWIAIAVFGALALPFAAEPQTAETFKSGGPIPYTTYLKRTRQAGPKSHAKPKPTAPKPAAGAVKPPGTPTPASARPAAPIAPAAATLQKPAPSAAPPPATGRPLAAPPAPAKPTTSTPPAAPPARAAPAPSLPETVTASPAPSPVGARLPPTAAIPPTELEAFVDGGVRQAMGADHIAGAAVVVVQDGQVVLEKGFGLARLNPATPVDARQTLFRLGSVSKVLTWIEVLKQVERGRLSPDTPIDDVLPPDLKLGLEGFHEPVRLRHLMTHTAGFEARELGRLFQTDPHRLLGQDEALKRDRSHRVRDVGRLTSYSNYGAALAGAAAASVAKTPFDQLMEDDLLKPAGLASTSFREPYGAEAGLPEPLAKTLADRLSDGFRRRDGGLASQPFAYGQDFAPAVSASASPHDMGRLMTLLLGAPGAPWGPRVTAALLTPLPSPTPGLPAWTYGLQQTPLAGGFSGFGHRGATPAFRSQLLLAPQLRLGVFIVTNTDSGQALVDRLPQAIVARFYAPAAPPAGAPEAAIDAARYAGLYLTSRRAYHGLEGLVNRLSRTEQVGVGLDGRLVVQGSNGAREFVPAGSGPGGEGRFTSPDGLRSIAFPVDPKAPDAPARLLVDPEQAEGAVRESWVHQPLILASAALIAAFAALLCFVGMGLRGGRDDRETRNQALAAAVQTVAGGAWLAAIGGFLIFRHGAHDAAALVGRWPNAWLVGASWAALGAALLGLVQLAQLRDIWVDRRRVQGWKVGRKLRHTLTTFVFLAFAAVLAAWGALEPWSS